jgi:hypothetical protein
VGTAVRGMGTLRVRGWVCLPVFPAVVTWWFLGEREVSGECKVGVVSFVMYGH